MSRNLARGSEPIISVGLVDRSDLLKLALEGEHQVRGRVLAAGEFEARPEGRVVRLEGLQSLADSEIEIRAADLQRDRFRIEATIGIDFHWEQRETQSFSGDLTLVRSPEGGITAINEVPLETYLTSVICSEMSASSPPEFLRAHAIISRSWLLAQLMPAPMPTRTPDRPGERIRWYDRQAHSLFDVCADDHCQRYQGLSRIASPLVAEAVSATRGQVLIHQKQVCDARFYKCCGGVTEAYRSAWHDQPVPYLAPVTDSEDPSLPNPPLTQEEGLRAFIDHPPKAFCNCDDPDILDAILPAYDRKTPDFFRWTVRLEAEEITALLRQKLEVDLGRILALEPVERGTSGRLVRLRFVGERGRLVVGKELEIRRALSSSHLYSSAFYVEPEGPKERPTAFILRGGGWGHGVGLCQIGAAVMARRGYDHRSILEHYYPGSALEAWYE